MDDLSLVCGHTVLSVGSRAYGLATAATDADRRGVHAAPTPFCWGFARPPTHVNGPAAERFSGELEEPRADLADHRERLLAVRRGEVSRR